MTTKKVFGIAGRKGHGKDTFAQEVVARNPEYVILHFADDLKEMCKTIFNLKNYDVQDPVGKELHFAVPVEMDSHLVDMRAVTGLDIQPQLKTAVSPRQILQYFGTDYVRAASDSYWVDRVLNKIAKSDKHVLIPDTRFPNELEALRGIGGKIIKIIRVGKSTDGNSVHASETALDDIRMDHTFSFKDGELDDLKRAGMLLGMDEWPTLRVRDPIQQLEAIVDRFNQELASWEHFFGWGANIVPSYISDGRKKYRIAHVSPVPATKPTPEQVESAGKKLGDALNDVLAAL